MSSPKGKVKDLLVNHEKNLKLIESLEQNETIREWREDYRSREKTGGVNAVSYTEVGSGSRDNASMQEKLMLEKENILQKIERIRYDVELTKLLLFQLDDDDQRLLRLRYMEEMGIRDVCDQLYISKSTFYRKHDVIIALMAQYLEQFDQMLEEEESKTTN